MLENSSVDILKPVPLEEWSALQEKTRKNWPLYAYLYYWIENAIRWKRKKPEINIQFYSPTGDSSCNTFMAVSNFALYIVILFTSEPDCETLKKIIRETKILNWSQGIYFAGNHDHFLPSILAAIESIKPKLGIDLHSVYPATYYFKSAEECIKLDIRVPDECYLKMLDRSHIPKIHEEWPHKDPIRPDLSTKYLITMVEMNGGVGLFLKEDNSLVSWAIHTDWDGMGMVQTIDKHKRKGYAKIVINALSKNLAEKGISTTLFIVKGNIASEKLFQSLGYKDTATVAWIIQKR